MINTEFKFHSVGQGCFYTGKIEVQKDSNSRFDFVYDCGTNSKLTYLENEIEKYKLDLNNGILDLLIISHFDADHVNGVMKLLNKIHCKRIVIPYYEPMERLLLYVNSTDESEEYRLMLQNPIAFFEGDRFNIDNIILIGGPEFDDEINVNEIPIKPKDDIKLDISIKLDVFEGNEEGEFIKKLRDLEKNTFTNEKLKFLKFPYRFSIGIWEFIFYLKKHENNILINRFSNDVNLLLEKYKIDLNGIFDETIINELRKIYRRYYGQNLNSTSLVTLHTPLIDFYSIYSWPKANCFSCFKSGTLLTGDIDIKSQRAKNKLLDYFQNYIQDVCVFQVPHHGAKANWPLINSNGLEVFCYYVISHGLGRIHHPSFNVIDNINLIQPKAKIILNNEIVDFEYFFFEVI